MEQTPAPINLDKLKSILGNAKKIMAVTEQKFPKSTNNQDTRDSRNFDNYAQNTPVYSETDEKEMDFSRFDNSGASSIHKPLQYTEEAVRNSNLPANVKEAMLKNPIPKLSGPPSKFSLDGLEDLVEKPRFKSPGIPLREGTDNYQAPLNMVTLSLDELNEIVDQRVEKRINEVLANKYTKTITEQAIKKTITTLMTEGKIVKKK